MKKLIPVAMLMALASASASAFFGDNVEFPLSDDNPYVNGVFAMNEYDMWDPRWYLQEAENMFSEIDNELSTNTNTNTNTNQPNVTYFKLNICTVANKMSCT